MIEKRILVVEDASSVAIMIADVLESEGYDVSIAENGKLALEKFNENPFPLVITDIEMPVMDGIELVGHLNKFPVPPMIFVETSHKDPSLIVDLMKKGVYDYLVKPIDVDGLPIKVKRAFEALELKRNMAVVEKEKMIRLEQQLDWYRWMERSRSKEDIDSDTMDKSFLHRLQTVLNQGGGFGSLVTIIDILTSSAKEEGEYYLIKKNLIDMLKDNKDMAQKALSVIQEIDTISHADINTEKISIDEFYKLVDSIVKESKTNASMKNQKIILSEMQSLHEDIKIEVNKKFFSSAFYEILLNGCKFSIANSNILVIMQLQEDSVLISTMNVPVASKDDVVGIPMEYENIIFEPLFRIVKTVNEEYDTLDYGLGLPMVESIIKKLNGKITVSNIEDHTDLSKGTKTRVNFTISLPVYME